MSIGETVLNLWVNGSYKSTRICDPFTDVDQLNSCMNDNYIYFKVWYEITYPFPNFNSGTVEVWEWISNLIHSTTDLWEWISNFISHFTGMWLPARIKVIPWSVTVTYGVVICTVDIEAIRLAQNGCNFQDNTYDGIFMEKYLFWWLG